MPSSLTPQQAGELGVHVIGALPIPSLTNVGIFYRNKSIIAYLSANDLAETLAAFRKGSDLPDDRFDATAAKQYENLLEKKWTSNSTLMKKLLALESRSEALQNELNSTRASFLNRNADVNNWLPQHPIRSLESHRDSINCIAFHPKYSLIASGSGDLTIRIWDWEDGTLERTLKGHTRAVCDVDYGDTSSGVLLASCSSDFTIKLWDTTDDYKNFKTLRGHDHTVSAVRFIPSGNLLASASRDMKVILWNVANGYRVKTIEGRTGWVRDISPSFDGQFLLSTGDDMTVRLWDISASQPICKFTATGHENRILCCAVAPAASFRYLASFLESKGSTMAAGITAEIMATGSRDKTIKLWDSRGRCIMTLTGHANWVRAIAFHPGGKYLLSVSDDKTMRCWDLSQQGRCVRSISNAHDGFITRLKWVPGIVKDTRNGTKTISYQRKGSPELPKSKLDERGQPGLQIRCVLATGAEDQKIQVFAFQANDRSHE